MYDEHTCSKRFGICETPPLDLHSHICRFCGTEWQHSLESAACGKCHTCPTCNQEQWARPEEERRRAPPDPFGQNPFGFLLKV